MDIENKFVTYEIAKALKELGFDIPCFSYIFIGNTGTNMDKVIYENPITAKNWNEDGLCISNPLWQDVIEWFEDKHNIKFSFAYWNGHSGILDKSGRSNKYECYVIVPNESSIAVRDENDIYMFDTSYQMRKASIIKAIEVLRRILGIYED